MHDEEDLSLWVSGVPPERLFSSFSLDIDLLPYLGESRFGSESYPVPPGNNTLPLDGIKLPGAEGLPVGFTQANVPVRIGYASLEWALELALQGVPASGDLTVQLYLAPFETWDPFQPRYELGRPVSAQVATGRKVTLSGSATLNGDQLNALNAKKLRLGVLLNGNLSASGPGTLTLSYEVKRAVLKVGLF